MKSLWKGNSNEDIEETPGGACAIDLLFNAARVKFCSEENCDIADPGDESNLLMLCDMYS